MNPAGTDPVAVTGATGYVGGRLVPRLLRRGHRVRCLVRDPGKLAHRPWAGDPHLEIVACDLLDRQRTCSALHGCSAVYYLVHSMLSAGGGYAAADRRLAAGFAAAARDADVARIVYLGGLGETGDHLSHHLDSRREVEAALATGGVPVTTLRAAMIVGSGSASYEILRYLVDRLPVMVTPRWVRTRCQPIAIRNVLGYLVDCLDEPRSTGTTLDIGGPDRLRYRDLIDLLAAARGLPRRLVLPVPVLTPRLSSLWIHLVTPIDRRIARPLAEGLRNEVLCRDDRAQQLMPQRLLSMREAIAAAESVSAVESRWSDAGAMPGDPDWAGGKVFTDRRTLQVAAAPGHVHAAVCRLGGRHGYYAADWLWRLRGAIDRLLGGPGLRRGRRDPTRVAYGDALDFWRVTAVEPDRLLEMRAEMKLPGVASLTFEIDADPGGTTSTLRQTARFRPRGLFGLAYWYAALPLHVVVFRGMLAGIARSAEAAAAQQPPVGPRGADAQACNEREDT